MATANRKEDISNQSESGKLKFAELVAVFQKVEETTKRLEMTSLLVELITKTPKDVIGKVAYLIQGKLYPDYMGIELGIAEKLLTKAVADLTGKTDAYVEADYKKSGDLGLSVEKLLRKKSQSSLMKKSLTVNLVYDTFDRIARSTGPGSIEAKIRFLTSLLNDASPLEAKFIARMAIGRLRLGVADMTVLDALAIAYGGDKSAREPIERAYNLSSDLGYVADVVAHQGLEGVKRFKITIGRPIRSMLAERLPSAKEILEKFSGVASAEYKYDGLRIQAHKGAGPIRLFSRRMENITEQFPDVAESVQESVRAKEAIVEGECVAVDQHTGEMLPFQVISQRRGRKYELERTAEEIPVTLFVFDLLCVDGHDLTNASYLERRKKLESIIAPKEHLALAHQAIVRDEKRIEEFMEEAVAAGCEGLVLKSTSDGSVYQAGARGWLWIKYKRSYRAEVQDTFDLVPVGAFAGRGRRAGSYGALLMAVYNKKKDIFETLCKLGSGFTDKDLEEMPRTLGKFEVKQKHARVVSLMKADTWFAPSMVLEVAADEITLSPLHTCAWELVRPGSGLALRFPRFTGKWREDRSPEDATTTHEAHEMYKKQLKKIDVEV